MRLHQLLRYFSNETPVYFYQTSPNQKSECQSECQCDPQILQPVCGDGVTYVNPCVLGCQSADYIPASNISVVSTLLQIKFSYRRRPFIPAN